MKSFLIQVSESGDPEIDQHIKPEVLLDALTDFFPQNKISVLPDRTTEILRSISEVLNN